ncbi:DoxX family membrane protein [Salicibibacter cibarius]|nr:MULTISPECIES: DoxX family membrane protein [Salicibibacter]QQK74501.1 DoxX family membrane protein [Salicibibacter cibarius]
MTMKYIITIIALSIVYILIPFTASAHVKWFSTETPIKAPLEEIVSPLFITLTLIISVTLGVLPKLSTKLQHFNLVKTADKRLTSLRPYSPILLRLGVAFALMIQLLSGSILAPEIPVRQMTMWIAILTISLLLMPNKMATQLGAIGLFMLFVFEIQFFGFFHMLEYSYYLAIVLALLIQKTRYHHFGIPILYLGTGFSLCWAALEKLVFPELSINIIESFNIPTFGIEPSILVVLGAFIEFVLGYLLLIGIFNRLLALSITLLFFMTTTVFGITEIIGHSIIHIILIIFIIEGKGFYPTPIEIHRGLRHQTVFIVFNFLLINLALLLLYYRFA